MTTPLTQQAYVAEMITKRDVLRTLGHERGAQLIEISIQLAPRRSDGLVCWLSELEAQIRSGHGPEYFRSRRKLWRNMGLAEQRGGSWFICDVVLRSASLPRMAEFDGQEAA